MQVMPNAALACVSAVAIAARPERVPSCWRQDAARPDVDQVYRRETDGISSRSRLAAKR